jgi:hypothetical protein
MGWSLATDTNRAEGDQDIGYSVGALCDKDGCKTHIHRGLAYVCGGEPYGEPHGCGRFFCYSHLAWYFNNDDKMSPQLCSECGKEWENPTQDELDIKLAQEALDRDDFVDLDEAMLGIKE